jgi:hypothetical protein
VNRSYAKAESLQLQGGELQRRRTVSLGNDMIEEPVLTREIMFHRFSRSSG